MLIVYRRNSEEAESPVTFLGVSEDITKACRAVKADVLEQRHPEEDEAPDDETLVIDPVDLQGEGYFDPVQDELSWHVESVQVL